MIVVSCDQASLEGFFQGKCIGDWRINTASGQVRDRCELRMSLNASIDTQPQGLFAPQGICQGRFGERFVSVNF